MTTILLVEDDVLLNNGICYALSKEHRIITVHSFHEAVVKLKEQVFDIALFDIALPDGNGIQLCKKIHEYADTPVIFLTAKDTTQDMIEGFQAGCDDYIAKPFEIDVLRHRIQAILRRLNTSSKHMFKQNNLVINFDRMQVIKNKNEIKLTATEYKLLTILVLNKGQVMTRDILLSKLWDIDQNFVDENTLNVNIRRLRQKIEEDPKNPKFILTVFGIGYTWGD